MNKKTTVGLFIPCFNEKDNISHVIQSIEEFRKSKEASDLLIITIVVDDGSTDGTKDELANLPIDALYLNPSNRGLGSATRQGMEIAHYLNCDIFVKFDADMQHDLHDIIPVIQPIIRGELDVCYGSRFLGSINYRMPMIRKLGNRFFTFLMRRMTGWKITDAQTGLMCFGRYYLSLFEIPSTYNPPQQALYDAKMKGMRYGEVPAQFHARMNGDSYISLKYIYKVFSSLLKLVFFYHPFRVFAAAFCLGTIFTLALVVENLMNSGNREGIYLSNSSSVLFLAIVSFVSLLLGLFAFSVLSRQSIIRNNKNYLYIVLDHIQLKN